MLESCQQRRIPPVPAAEAAGAAPAIASRAQQLTTSERRRLGRWASAALRDPRASTAIAGARDHGQEVLAATPERKRRWQRVSAPLYEGLVAAAAEDRRYRLIMLAGHFVAILAVVNIPNGLPLPVAVLAVLAAPASAWLAWGRATAWLGAIDAALGAELVDQLDDGEVEALQRAWRNSIEEQPPVAPPLVGAVSTFLPSALLVVVLVAFVVARVR
jgi:hypothetical protein